jgi:hypothetical protein
MVLLFESRPTLHLLIAFWDSNSPKQSSVLSPLFPNSFNLSSIKQYNDSDIPQHNKSLGRVISGAHFKESVAILVELDETKETHWSPIKIVVNRLQIS